MISIRYYMLVWYQTMSNKVDVEKGNYHKR